MILRCATIFLAAITISACNGGEARETGGEVSLTPDAAMLGARSGPIGMTDRQVLTWLTNNNRGAVELAEYVKARSSHKPLLQLSDSIRTERNRLVRDGGMLEKQLAPPTAEDSMAAASIDTLAAIHSRMMAELRTETGDDLDRALAKALVKSHERTLDTLQKWNGKVLDPKLNAAMSKAAPIIEKHLTEARRVEEQLKQQAKARADSVKKAQAKAAAARKDSLARAQRDTAGPRS
jgi:hypothetical protein